MGVVYYANYLRWFEVGRNGFFRDLGYSYRKLEETGVFLPVVESYCAYKSPAEYDDIIVIKTKLKELSFARLRFEYDIIKQPQDKLLAYGHTVHGFINSQGKPVALKKVVPEIWNTLKKVVER